MNAAIVDRWNEVVGPQDSVWHLGDIGFGGPKDLVPIITALNGVKGWIKGNHDHSKLWKNQELRSLFQLGCYEYHELKIPDEEMDYDLPIILCHYPFAVWNKRHFGSWNLYGHCFDMATEMLTHDGWRKFSDLSIGTKIYSLNVNTGLLENDNVLELIDLKDYSGLVFEASSRSFAFRVTSDHTMISVDRPNGTYHKNTINELSRLNRMVFPVAGYYTTKGVNLSADLVRLLILITADGSLSNSNLIRIRVKKVHKICYIRSLLDKLGIKYRDLMNTEYVSFNFTLPDELKGWRLKPLDDKLMQCSPEQFFALIEAYGYSDGHKYNDRLTCIYSSKESEIDLLQAICALHGASSVKHTKTVNKLGKWKKRISHQLTIILNRNNVCTRKPLNVAMVEKERFWCIKSKNQTLITRRNGRVLISGNCHGTFRQHEQQGQLDVGVDCWDYRPVNYDTIKVEFTHRMMKK